MFGSILVTSLVLPLLNQTPPAPINPAWGLRVATPTFHADSQRTGASAAYRNLTPGKPLVTYPYAGRDLCMSASAVPTEPDDAGYGWRVQIIPLRNEGGNLVAHVEWQRLWHRGERLTNSATGSLQVTFKPGEKIMFDYMTSGDRLVSSNMAREARAVGGCAAIGMGLEIGLESAPRTEVVEANLWLVHTLPNGTEQSQQQTMRLSPGSSADYFFDDIPLTFYFNSDTVRTSGRLTLVDVVSGTSQVDVNIGQYILDKTSRPARGGSSTFTLKAGPGEVLAVQVPKVGPNAERMSLRLQLKQIR
jgi:hypothetical protein